MALENAPWAVDGAKHSAAVARTLAYASTSGAEGIVEPADLRVRATQTPSGSVRVAPGGIAILNRAPNGGQQTYTARNVSETLVEVQPTGSGGGRTDYVWAHIIDPEYGGQFPENPQTAQYFFLTASAAQPEGNGWYRLARIDIPASTATITQAMVTDLREVANPRSERVLHARPRVSDDDTGNAILLNGMFSSGGEYFPGGGGSPNEFVIKTPEWATRMIIRADWIGVRYQANTNPNGRYWVEFGDQYRDHTWPDNRQWEFGTQAFQFDSPGASNNTMRTNWILGDSVPLPSKLRGKDVTFVFKAGLLTSAARGHVSMDFMSGLVMEVSFAEVAQDAHTL